MARQTYLDLAAVGARLPLATHLVLHDRAEVEQTLLDGRRLGAVIAEAADRFGTTLAVPLMDLSLERAALLQACGVPPAERDGHRFDAPPAVPETIALTPRMRATCDAVAEVARRGDLVPIGMTIGPFSLATKLIADPITPVFMAGSGVTAEDDREVALIEALLAISERVVHRYLQEQLDAGATAVVVCEPAANQVYFSPRQLAANPAVFERFVMEPMQRVTRLLAGRCVDLIFHDCGELTDDMVRRFATLGAAMLSFGSSRRLWEDARLVPKDTVLYGNLPTRRFFGTDLTVGEVGRLAGELLSRMREAEHPFILGSECDILSVPGREEEIWRKVDALIEAEATARS